MKLTILINCFNERNTIIDVIEEAKSLAIDKEIIVIDNCSSDGTKEILEGLKEDKEIRIVIHQKNMGAGYSGCEGIRLAKGEYFCAPGADREYRMIDLLEMLKKVERENLDAVFGSRLLARSNESKFQLIKERPFWLGTIIGTTLVNFLYGRNFTDTIATKVMKTDILKKISFQSHNQAFEFELVSNLCKMRCNIGEFPVWYKPRTHKQGKTIRALDMLPALMAIVKVKFFR